MYLIPTPDFVVIVLVSCSCRDDPRRCGRGIPWYCMPSRYAKDKERHEIFMSNKSKTKHINKHWKELHLKTREHLYDAMAQIHSYIASAPLLGASSRKAIALGPMMAVEHPVSRRGAMALGVLSFMPHVTSAEEEKPLVPGHWPTQQNEPQKICLHDFFQFVSICIFILLR